MNHYEYQDIEVGMKESFYVHIEQNMLEQFQTLSGDVNPLHSNKDFAVSKGYPDRVCYGMMTASFLSTLAGVYLPGEKSLIHSVETKFVKPVYPEDDLLVEGTVIEKNDLFSVFAMKVVITNQHKEKVLRGKMQIGFL